MNPDGMDLTPEGDPPTRTARWCPSCRMWVEYLSGRRRCFCGAAVLRPAYRSRRPRERGELRPGVVAEFEDPRDRLKS